MTEMRFTNIPRQAQHRLNIRARVLVVVVWVEVLVLLFVVGAQVVLLFGVVVPLQVVTAPSLSLHFQGRVLHMRNLNTHGLVQALEPESAFEIHPPVEHKTLVVVLGYNMVVLWTGLQ